MKLSTIAATLMLVSLPLAAQASVVTQQAQEAKAEALAEKVVVRQDARHDIAPAERFAGKSAALAEARLTLVTRQDRPTHFSERHAAERIGHDLDW